MNVLYICSRTATKLSQPVLLIIFGCDPGCHWRTRKSDWRPTTEYKSYCSFSKKLGWKMISTKDSRWELSHDGELWYHSLLKLFKNSTYQLHPVNLSPSGLSIWPTSSSSLHQVQLILSSLSSPPHPVNLIQPTSPSQPHTVHLIHSGSSNQPHLV